MTSVLHRAAIGAALLGAAVPAIAQDPAPDMTVAQFLGTVDALKAKSVLALFSPDVGRLKRAGEAAMDRFYAQPVPADASRRSCPPPHRDLKLKDGEFLGFLKAVPAPDRPTTSVTQAVAEGMTRRFPCR